MDKPLDGFPDKWVPPSKVEQPDGTDSNEGDPAPQDAEAPMASVTPISGTRPPPHAHSPTGASHSATAVMPSAASSMREPSIEDQVTLGQELATIFRNANVYPVFIFGSRGSGKTSLLASLFRYMQMEVSDATIKLNEDLWPSGEAKWSQHAQLAQQLYYRKVLEFINRKAPPATQDTTPFFIPVTVTRTTGEETRYAFLEGKGEWYMPNDQADVPYKPFHGLLQGLLQHYNTHATVIYVAPYSTGVLSRDRRVEPADSADMRRSDLGLLGAIDEYVNLRRAIFHRDHHVFLMTKWDMACTGLNDPDFQRPHGEVLQEELRKRFQLAWARFQNLNFQGSVQNKMYSAYSAGVIDNLTVAPPAASDQEAVDFHARKLWDLIHEHNTGHPLYPDVRPKPPSIIDRFISMLRR